MSASDRSQRFSDDRRGTEIKEYLRFLKIDKHPSDLKIRIKIY
jgi:hypothetical protein